MIASPDSILQYRPAVQTALERFIRRQKYAAGGGLGWNKDIAERLQAFAVGGKLLRGCLVCYSYGLETGAQPTEEVLNVAVALELVHTALLIHDDLIDHDDLRRGKPAIHNQYGQLARQQHLADPVRVGIAMALCGGDAALFWALSLLGSETRVCKLFSQALAAVCAGQMEDVYLSASAVLPSRRRIYAVTRAKTATYSIALPLAAGAVLAGQPVVRQHQLFKIGLSAGIIFQIRDDELGVLGHASMLGKPIGSDIREGKKTLPYYYLQQAATASEKQYLQTIFGNTAAADTDLLTVMDLMRHYDVSKRLKQDIDRLRQTTGRHIEQLAIKPAAKASLRQLVKFCAARQT